MYAHDFVFVCESQPGAARWAQTVDDTHVTFARDLRQQLHCATAGVLVWRKERELQHHAKKVLGIINVQAPVVLLSQAPLQLIQGAALDCHTAAFEVFADHANR